MKFIYKQSRIKIESCNDRTVYCNKVYYHSYQSLVTFICSLLLKIGNSFTGTDGMFLEQCITVKDHVVN